MNPQLISQVDLRSKCFLRIISKNSWHSRICRRKMVASRGSRVSNQRWQVQEKALSNCSKWREVKWSLMIIMNSQLVAKRIIRHKILIIKTGTLRAKEELAAAFLPITQSSPQRANLKCTKCTKLTLLINLNGSSIIKSRRKFSDWK